jgi:cell division protein FtsQ
LRRIAVRREEGRRRLRWFTIVGLVIGGVVVILLLLTSPILSVRQVNVEGVVYADPDLISSIVDSIDGEPILTVDLDAAEGKLLAIPWVRQARVSMHLPARVTIEVVERSPIAFFRSVDGFNRVIDRDGRVLDVIEGDPTDYTPIIGTGPNLSAGQNTEQPFLGAAELINALPADLQTRLLTVTVSPEGEVSLALTNDVEVLFGRPDDFQVKLVGVVNEIKRQGSSRYAVIDVSSGQPSVR